MTDTAGSGPTEEPSEAVTLAPVPPKRWKRVLRRVALGIGVTVGALLLIAALLYSFGGMERPAPEYRAAYDQLVAQGSVAPIEKRFVVPIPGCRCHSTDPVAQMEHSAYRIRDCMSCH